MFIVRKEFAIYILEHMILHLICICVPSLHLPLDGAQVKIVEAELPTTDSTCRPSTSCLPIEGQVKIVQTELHRAELICTPSTSTAGSLEIIEQPESILEPYVEKGNICVLPSTSSVREQAPCLQEPQKRNDSTSVLHNIGVTRVGQLSPTARKLYKTTVMLTSSVRRLKKRNTTLTKKLHKFTPEENLNRATNNLEPHVAEFVKSQVRLHGKHVKGRRYTLNDKCLGLILYKQSPQAYKTFSNLFTVPSRKTINSLLQHIPLNVGLNEQLMSSLKEIVNSLTENEKLSVLLFDEMAIQPQISFNTTQMCFDGFEDLGDSHSNKVADHAIVFMLRGVTKNWKQPVSYGFSHSGIKTVDLVRMLKHIIQKCQDIGFRIIATVSDQGSANVAAINYLMNNSIVGEENFNTKCFKIDNQVIYHIFDAPHLIKGIRNNLLSKNLVWNDRNTVYTAKWDDIYTAYKLDNASGELRLMPRLTEEHCNPDRIKKMKVANATQVFSHSVAATMNILIRTDLAKESGESLGPSAVGTARVLKFFDSLFDSVNGNTFYPRNGKELRCALSKDSQHHVFYPIAKEALRNMHFEKNNTKHIPPSLKNWIFTIEGLQTIYSNLKAQISYLRTRAFNQDPLENFFGQLRQRGARNINPTTVQFANHFKSLLITNLTSKHSLNANCQEDSSRILANVKTFIKDKPIQRHSNCTIPEEILTTISATAVIVTQIDAFAISYVSGYLCKKLKTLYQCDSCKKQLICSNIDYQWHSFVQAKEFSDVLPLRLKYATPQLIQGLFKVYKIVKILLPELAYKKNGFVTMLDFVQTSIDFEFVQDCSHIAEIEKCVIKQFSFLLSHNWANGINRILCRKDFRYRGNDCIYRLVKNYVLRKRK